MKNDFFTLNFEIAVLRPVYQIVSLQPEKPLPRLWWWETMPGRPRLRDGKDHLIWHTQVHQLERTAFPRINLSHWYVYVFQCCQLFAIGWFTYVRTLILSIDCRLPKIILTVVPKIMNPSNDFASPIAQRVDKGQFPARPDRELYPTLTRCPQVQPCLSEATKQGTW